MRKRNGFIFRIVPLLSLMVMGFFACSNVDIASFNRPSEGHIDLSLSSMMASDPASKVNLGRGKKKHRCQHDTESCFTETIQEPIVDNQPVDVLFVVQTSDPMIPERQAIISGISSFVASLPENSDVNVAVMLAHGSTSPLSGELYQAGTEPIVLKSSELSNTQIQQSLAIKLTQVVTDPASGGGEEGLYSLFHSITTPALLAEAQAQSFFRTDAALAVVFIADRRDICAVVPAGVPAETDPLKIAARIRDCEGLTVQGLTNRLKLLKGTLPLQVSGILYADAPAPAGNELGYGYLEMIALNGGVAIDFANDDIASGLSIIAELIGSAAEIQNIFPLSHSGVIPSSVKVTVNGQTVSFTVTGDVVTVTQSIPSGAVVVISYCVSSIQNSCCEPHHRRKEHEDRGLHLGWFCDKHPNKKCKKPHPHSGQR